MKIRKVIISAFTGLISLASLSLSFSIAWFAAGTQLYVDQFEVGIRGERNLVISTSDDLDSFKSEITEKDLNECGPFAPVSSMFDYKWKNEENPIPSFYEYVDSSFFPSSGIPYDPSRIETGFFQQSIYLMCDDDAYISVDPFRTYFESNVEANKVTASKYVKKNPEANYDEVLAGLNNLTNSLRFSIYDVSERKYYIIDPTKEEVTYLGGVLDNDKDKYFDVYEDTHGEYREVLYGEVINRDLAVYEDVGDEDILAHGNYSVFNANHKKGTKRFLKEESLSRGLSFKEEDSLSLEDIESVDIEENPMVINLYHTVPKELIFSVYLEGWDLDCINQTMGGNFDAQIQFKILREM